MKVAVMGASGYVGGELVRLLLGHPQVELVQATSNQLAGQPLHARHPNLYGQTNLTFVHHDQITACDVLFLALPHGMSMHKLPEWSQLASRVIDLSADFRLRYVADYETYYHISHPHTEWLQSFVPGIPELYREQLQQARYVSVPGCMANAGILALSPLAAADLIAGEVFVDGRTGSSGSGAEPGPASHHAERSGVMRVFKPTDHRHQAEISQCCSVPVYMSATAVEAVRGVQVLCHVTLTHAVTEKEIWTLYRQHYGSEPFVRLIKRRTGLYRLPEPKILTGTNYCDIGFVLAADKRHLVVIAALDNLVKGSAGNAVQSLNIMGGWNEREGLNFAGLHPI